MRRIQHLIYLAGTLLIVSLILSVGRPVPAHAADPPQLVISQLKITSSNGQFITLYNAGPTTLDMSKYQLEYFNNYDLAKATSSRLIALSGTLAPHSYYMVNDDSLLLCYQLTVDSVSLGLSSTAGMVEVLAFNQATPGKSVAPELLDYVAWSKTAAAGAQTLPGNPNAFLQRLPVDDQNNPDITSPGGGTWQSVQPDAEDACNLVSAAPASPDTSVPTGLSQLLPSTEPPATIISVTEAAGTIPAASLPPADIGLMAPQLSEVLPNPNGTGNDDTDEFVEIYNPNDTAFDLSGFELQAGTTVQHMYAFPVGASLPAQSFTAFYATTTGLSLSNSGGQVKLLDPADNSLSATDVYGAAADGRSWGRANGKWYWTTTPTPNAANIINQPPASKAKTKTVAKNTAATKAKGKVKAAKTAKTAKTAKLASDTTPTTAPRTPVHFRTLALIAGLALLYGAYEYRADLGNHLYRFRKYLRSRQADRA